MGHSSSVAHCVTPTSEMSWGRLVGCGTVLVGTVLEGGGEAVARCWVVLVWLKSVFKAVAFLMSVDGWRVQRAETRKLLP